MSKPYWNAEQEKEFIDRLGQHNGDRFKDVPYKVLLEKYINGHLDSDLDHHVVGVAHARMRLAELEGGVRHG